MRDFTECFSQSRYIWRWNSQASYWLTICIVYIMNISTRNNRLYITWMNFLLAKIVSLSKKSFVLRRNCTKRLFAIHILQGVDIRFVSQVWHRDNLSWSLFCLVLKFVNDVILQKSNPKALAHYTGNCKDYSKKIVVEIIAHI